MKESFDPNNHSYSFPSYSPDPEIVDDLELDNKNKTVTDDIEILDETDYVHERKILQSELLPCFEKVETLADLKKLLDEKVDTIEKTKAFVQFYYLTEISITKVVKLCKEDSEQELKNFVLYLLEKFGGYTIPYSIELNSENFDGKGIASEVFFSTFQLGDITAQTQILEVLMNSKTLPMEEIYRLFFQGLLSTENTDGLLPVIKMLDKESKGIQEDFVNYICDNWHLEQKIIFVEWLGSLIVKSQSNYSEIATKLLLIVNRSTPDMYTMLRARSMMAEGSQQKPFLLENQGLWSKKTTVEYFDNFGMSGIEAVDVTPRLITAKYFSDPGIKQFIEQQFETKTLDSNERLLFESIIVNLKKDDLNIFIDLFKYYKQDLVTFIEVLSEFEFTVGDSERDKYDDRYSKTLEDIRNIKNLLPNNYQEIFKKKIFEISKLNKKIGLKKGLPVSNDFFAESRNSGILNGIEMLARQHTARKILKLLQALEYGEAQLDEIVKQIDNFNPEVELSKNIISTTIQSLQNERVEFGLDDIKDLDYENLGATELSEREIFRMIEIYKENYKGFGTEITQQLIDKFKENLYQKGSSFNILRYQGNIIGFFKIDDIDNNKVHVSAFNVDSAYRGVKIGETMLQESIDNLAKEKIIFAECNYDLPIANNYISRGFIGVESGVLGEVRTMNIIQNTEENRWLKDIKNNPESIENVEYEIDEQGRFRGSMDQLNEVGPNGERIILINFKRSPKKISFDASTRYHIKSEEKTIDTALCQFRKISAAEYQRLLGETRSDLNPYPNDKSEPINQKTAA